jgi:hypothetical protein
MLFLWFLPALLLAPVLAWAVFKRDPDQRSGPASMGLKSSAAAALEKSVQGDSKKEPERGRDTNQAQQVPSRESPAFDFTDQSHALT